MPTLDIAGWKASYQETGVGLPMVFIPGITEYKESFEFQFRGLSDRYRVISYDVRTTSGSETIEDLAEDLAKLLDSLRLASAVIAGHSFGGLIAQQFAYLHPERTTALVLLSTFAKAPDPSQAKLLRYMSSGHQNDPEGAMARLARFVGLGPKPVFDPDSFLDWVAMQTAKTPLSCVHSRIKMIRDFDSRPWLEQLWMPLLALVGQHDRPPFLSATQMIQRATPDSCLEVVEDTGHFPHIQRHDLVNLYIDDFLKTRLLSLVD
ncbi:MAG: alpha/beta hydrolase [Armatimonadetes bacterium]|nr:alpha/beta hydrolase [Armatimonadota bacterium]